MHVFHLKTSGKRLVEYALLLLLVFTLFVCTSAIKVYAQGDNPSAVPSEKVTEPKTQGQWVPLSNIPVFKGGGATVSQVINDLFIILVAIGAVIAVLKIAVAGITFMLSESFTNRTAAKESIQNSLLGLVLVLSVVLILTVINPGLVSTSILDGVPSSPGFEYDTGTTAVRPQQNTLLPGDAGDEEIEEVVKQCNGRVVRSPLPGNQGTVIHCYPSNQ